MCGDRAEITRQPSLKASGKSHSAKHPQFFVTARMSASSAPSQTLSQTGSASQLKTWSCRSANSTNTLAAGCSTSSSFNIVAPSLVIVTSYMYI